MRIRFKTLQLIGAVLLVLISAGSHFWLLSKSTPDAQNMAAISEQYQEVNINSEKKQAESLLQGKDNNVGMPLQTPTADKIGRDNPFAGI